jgi:type II secretory pathway component PulF
VPLVQTAERTNTLAWTLTELGELRSGKALRVARRFSIFVAPLLVIAVGAIVGVVVAGMFIPLVNLIDGLSR